MPVDVLPISAHKLDDVVQVVNESSHGMAIEHNLDAMGFLLLAQYWNFSYEYSLVGYVEGEPAAVIIVATDAEACEAYVYYWGAMPKFWNRRIALEVFEACCGKLCAHGYTMLYGDSAPDHSARSYRLIHSYPQHSLREMSVHGLELPPADRRYELRRADVDVVSHIKSPLEPVYWCQRPSFLRRSSRWLQFVAAYADGALQAYAAVFPRDSRTELIDIRCSHDSFEPGYELLRWLLLHNFRQPFVATAVIQGTYSDRLLSHLQFRVIRERTTLYRDLMATCSKNPAQG